MLIPAHWFEIRGHVERSRDIHIAISRNKNNKNQEKYTSPKFLEIFIINFVAIN